MRRLPNPQSGFESLTSPIMFSYPHCRKWQYQHKITCDPSYRLFNSFSNNFIASRLHIGLKLKEWRSALAIFQIRPFVRPRYSGGPRSFASAPAWSRSLYSMPKPVPAVPASQPMIANLRRTSSGRSCAGG